MSDFVESMIRCGFFADYRYKLPRHDLKRFARRFEEDILGVCTHHSASANQDPFKTARYHVGPNHVSKSGCPGLCYTFVISDEIEPDCVIVANDIEAVTWSQGKSTLGNYAWAGDENKHLVSILVMGDFNSAAHKGETGEPSLTQMARWHELVSILCDEFDIGPNGHFGHFDFGKAACPGWTLQQEIEDYREGAEHFEDAKEWQDALLEWDPSCLPKYGADGVWGRESAAALKRFEETRASNVRGVRNPFIEMKLLNHIRRI